VTQPEPQALAPYSSGESFSLAHRAAESMASSNVLPQQYRGNVPNILVALDMASRIGASPISVMQNIHIVQGKPTWASSFLVAMVNACGHFGRLKFRYQGEGGAWGCRAYAVERETGDELVGTLVTMDMARAEGWLSKPGSKWKTMPEQMLAYRAAAFWARVHAPELTLGMHTREEMIDVRESEARPPAFVEAEPIEAEVEERRPRKDAGLVRSNELRRDLYAHLTGKTPLEIWNGVLGRIDPTAGNAGGYLEPHKLMAEDSLAARAILKPAIERILGPGTLKALEETAKIRAKAPLVELRAVMYATTKSAADWTGLTAEDHAAVIDAINADAREGAGGE
jgi:hypothetical protein